MRGRWRGVVLGALLLASCGPDKKAMEEAAAITHGEPRNGRELIRKYGCDACHTVPGVRGADRTVGPPLGGIVHRMYIAGVLTNTPEHMVKWIQDPQSIDPKTAMPDVGVTESDARDITAYLYSLK